MKVEGKGVVEKRKKARTKIDHRVKRSIARWNCLVLPIPVAVKALIEESKEWEEYTSFVVHVKLTSPGAPIPP